MRHKQKHRRETKRMRNNLGHRLMNSVDAPKTSQGNKLGLRRRMQGVGIQNSSGLITDAVKQLQKMADQGDRSIGFLPADPNAVVQKIP
jgi:hypothetical protein